MPSLLSSIFFIFSLLSLSRLSPLSPLLSLNCTPPSNRTSIYSKPIEAQLDYLASEVTKTRFIVTSGTSPGYGRFSGLMQCRLYLNRTACAHCAQNAIHTISTLCPNSNSVTAWFDGCYIHYFHNYSNTTHENLKATNMSCSNGQTGAVDLVQFEPALETLLLRLRAEVNLATHHGFSYGHLTYGKGSKVYSFVECVRSLSPKECEACAGEAIEELQEYCGGKHGGTVASGYCLVRFESHKFFSDIDVGESDSGGGSGAVSVSVIENCGYNYKSYKIKAALVWVIGVAGLAGFVLFACLLQRVITNRARVATLHSADGEEKNAK